MSLAKVCKYIVTILKVSWLGLHGRNPLSRLLQYVNPNKLQFTTHNFDYFMTNRNLRTQHRLNQKYVNPNQLQFMAYNFHYFMTTETWKCNAGWTSSTHGEKTWTTTWCDSWVFMIIDRQHHPLKATKTRRKKAKAAELRRTKRWMVHSWQTLSLCYLHNGCRPRWLFKANKLSWWKRSFLPQKVQG